MGLRDRLRAETRPQHAALEARLNLLRGDFGHADLVRLLERHYGYHLPCERQISLLPDALAIALAPRAKTPLLGSDLREFGHTTESLAALPECPVEKADTPAKALGRWYVLEGSTLGGQLLVRHFETALPSASGGLSFFRSYGPRGREMWQGYCALLEEHSDPATDDEAITSAIETFTALSEWLVPGR